MIIKDAELEDLDDILALQKLCYRENAERYGDYGIQPLTQSMPELEKEFGEQLLLKIEDEGAIIASVRGFEKNKIC